MSQMSAHGFVPLFLMLAGPAWAQPESGVRDQLEGFGRALDRAVQAVSRAGTLHVLSGEHSSRGYYLKGYGAVFMLPPRALPSDHRLARRETLPGRPSGPLEVALRELEGSLNAGEPEPLHELLEGSLLEADPSAEGSETARPPFVEPPPASAPEPPEWAMLRQRLEARKRVERQREQQLRTLEKQIEAFQRDAERMRQLAERHMEELRRQIQARMVPTPPTAPTLSPAPPQPAALPAPPWSFWFELSTESDQAPRSQDAVVSEVRAAVSRVMVSEGGRLGMLDPEESLVVAVDFVPQDAFAPTARPERTLVLRVRKKELDNQRAGRLRPEELDRRIEIVEY
jgi:hypothetical protein